MVLKIYGVTSVGEKGQIVLPLECRKELNIKEGENFNIQTVYNKFFVIFSKKDNSFKENTKFIESIFGKKMFENNGEIKIGSRFQFVIPTEIRKNLKIKKGDSIIVIGKDERLGIGFIKNDQIDFLIESIKYFTLLNDADEKNI